jgi:hypothetical protein
MLGPCCAVKRDDQGFPALVPHYGRRSPVGERTRIKPNWPARYWGLLDATVLRNTSSGADRFEAVDDQGDFPRTSADGRLFFLCGLAVSKRGLEPLPTALQQCQRPIFELTDSPERKQQGG